MKGLVLDLIALEQAAKQNKLEDAAFIQELRLAWWNDLAKIMETREWHLNIDPYSYGILETGYERITIGTARIQIGLVTLCYRGCWHRFGTDTILRDLTTICSREGSEGACSTLVRN
jgi:hypothetical protein